MSEGIFITNLTKKKYKSYEEMLADIYKRMKSKNPKEAAEAKRIYNELWERFSSELHGKLKKIELPTLKKPKPTKERVIPNETIRRDVWACDECQHLNIGGQDIMDDKCEKCGAERIG